MRSGYSLPSSDKTLIDPPGQAEEGDAESMGPAIESV